MTPHVMFPNQIRIHDQDVRTAGVAIADWVSAAQDGWLVIYRSRNFNSTEIVGCAPVYQGLNLGVKVAVNVPLIGDRPMLFAALQADNDVSVYSSEAMTIVPLVMDRLPQMAS